MKKKFQLVIYEEKGVEDDFNLFLVCPSLAVMPIYFSDVRLNVENYLTIMKDPKFKRLGASEKQAWQDGM